MASQLSQRIHNMAESATLAIAKQIQALRAQGREIYDLSIGEPNLPTPAIIQAAAKHAIDTGQYASYPPIAGYQDLRKAIAHKLGKENDIPCTPEQVIVSNGAKQALFNLFMCLCNPGDEVIVYTPYWGSYLQMIRLTGATPICLQGTWDNNFEPTIAQVANAITPQTKAIIFSSPSNPNGLVLSKDHLLSLAKLLQQHPDVVVIADEIYEYIHFGTSFTSIGSIPSLQDRVITVNGFSKSYAMTGWRIGYLAAPLWLAQACEKLQGQSTGGACGIAQRAALAAFELPQSTLQQICTTYSQKVDVAMQHLQDMKGIICHRPLGTFYLFPDISCYFGYTDGEVMITDADTFVLYLLQEAQISIVSGKAFGVPTCVRLSVATTDEIITKAMERMKQALNKLRPASSN